MAVLENMHVNNLIQVEFSIYLRVYRGITLPFIMNQRTPNYTLKK